MCGLWPKTDALGRLHKGQGTGQGCWLWLFWLGISCAQSQALSLKVSAAFEDKLPPGTLVPSQGFPSCNGEVAGRKCALQPVLVASVWATLMVLIKVGSHRRLEFSGMLEYP